MAIQTPNNSKRPTLTAARSLELSILPFDKWTDEDKLSVIALQYSESKTSLDRKKANWLKYTKLYLNQYRKDQNPDKLGSKLLFTKFHEAYAQFTSDELDMEFEPRALDDFDKVPNTNRVAKFDWQEFQGAEIWNEWTWDTLFYSYGILDTSCFDEKKKILRPETVSPYLFLYDPIAPHLRHARYCGLYRYFDYYGLTKEEWLDQAKVKMFVENRRPGDNEATNEMLQQEREAKRILIGLDNYSEAMMPSSYFEVLCWYLKVNGETWKVATDAGCTIVLGEEKLDNNDSYENDGGSEFPFIMKRYFGLPRAISGTSIPDVIEDDHRANVQLVNYMFEGVKKDATDRVLYNVKALLNPRDLSTVDSGKSIATTQSPDGNVVPFPKTGVVNDSTIAFLNLLENRSDLALGRLSMGAQQTATAAAIAKTRQDLMIAARAKEMIAADKEFWYVWLKRYRKYMDEGGKKFVRLVGESGAKEFKDMSPRDFVPSTDPDIIVSSKLVSEPKKITLRRDLAALLVPIQNAGGSPRELLKNILYLIDMKKDDITNVLPPTPHEIRADAENDILDQEKVAPVHENDEDSVHISIHMRATDNKSREAHIRAHVLNYLRKAGLVDPKAPPGPTGGPPGTKKEEMAMMGRPLASTPPTGKEVAPDVMGGGSELGEAMQAMGGYAPAKQ